MSKIGKKVYQSEKGNLYVDHADFQIKLRLYADVEELKKDKNWRDRVALREGEDSSFYLVLAKTPLVELEGL